MDWDQGDALPASPLDTEYHVCFLLVVFAFVSRPLVCPLEPTQTKQLSVSLFLSSLCSLLLFSISDQRLINVLYS